MGIVNSISPDPMFSKLLLAVSIMLIQDVDQRPQATNVRCILGRSDWRQTYAEFLEGFTIPEEPPHNDEPESFLPKTVEGMSLIPDIGLTLEGYLKIEVASE